jgi:hypothetical protein
MIPYDMDRHLQAAIWKEIFVPDKSNMMEATTTPSSALV